MSKLPLRQVPFYGIKKELILLPQDQLERVN